MARPQHSQAVEDPFHSLVVRLINLALWCLFLSPKWSRIPTHHSCLQVWSKEEASGYCWSHEWGSLWRYWCDDTACSCNRKAVPCSTTWRCLLPSCYYPKNIYAVNAPFKEDGIFSCDINTKMVLTIWFDRKLDGGSYWHSMFFIYVLKSCLAFLWAIY